MDEVTFNLGGTMITDEAHSELRVARLNHQAVIHRFVEARAGECPNCGGVTRLVFWFYPPVGSRDAEKTYLTTPVDNELKTVEVRLYTCPVCAADSPTRHEMAWLTSGLESAERAWRLNYFDGRHGKDLALAGCLELLAAVPQPAGWLTLYGDYGMGKSGMLKSLVAQFIVAGVPAAYVRAADVLAELRASFGDDSKATEAAIIGRFAGYQFLAVDEVDRASDTAWARGALFALLDRRYNARESKATALALNANPVDLPETLRYLASRMTDGARLEVGGQTLRGGENE